MFGKGKKHKFMAELNLENQAHERNILYIQMLKQQIV